MCGIAGVVFTDQNGRQESALKAMTDSLKHRGPDGEGHWSNSSQTVHLGHRRLAVIDLSAAARQPMHYANRYTITYNGELYNYTELKAQLSAKGHLFHSNSDTEVILAAYAEQGADCLPTFDGMFAFAIWDEKEKTLFCARDRFGEKPFYYGFRDKHTFVFGSEIKAVLKGGVSKEVDRKMVFYYLNYDVVENSRQKNMTFYEKVHSLEAAHTLTVKPDGSYEKKRYWQLNAEINSNLTLSQAKTRFRELFYTAVKRRLRSDVTVGSSLSGGLDSSAVVLAMNELLENSSSQNTFSARFHDPALDEGNYMQAVVEGKNITPHYVYPNAETLIDEIDLLFYHQEQPFGSASIFAQWEVMRLAQQKNVTVLLDGQGADEILAGYPRYFRSYFKGLLRQNPKAFMEEVKAYEQLYKHTWKSGPSFYMECYLPQLLLLAGKLKRSMGSSANYQQLDSDFFHTFKNEPSPFTYYRNLNDDLHHSTTVYGLEKLLRFSDRNAMAFSREVRLPFLFHDLVEFVFSQPDQMKLNKGWTKYLLREAMENELPSSIKNRVNKIGFEPPQGDWMKQKQMSERIVAARKQLISQNYIEPGARITDWQALMVDLLLQQKY